MSRKGQRSLFENPAGAEKWLARPPLNIRAHLKEDLAMAISSSRHSRPQIVDRMNAAFRLAELPNRMSLARLDSWTAPSKAALPDLLEMEFLCWACENRLLLARQAGRLQLLLVDWREQKFLELGKAEQELRTLSRRRQLLRQAIEEDK